MSKVKLFGTNVMVEQRQSEACVLHLPKDVSSANSNLFEIVVVAVGSEVELVEVGDVVLLSHMPPVMVNPDSGNPSMIVQEVMIQGIVK